LPHLSNMSMKKLQMSRAIVSISRPTSTKGLTRWSENLGVRRLARAVISAVSRKNGNSVC
jgi:hypothetical protein